MSAISYLRLLQTEDPPPADEGGWSFTDYDSALKLCVAALAIKIVLVTLLTVRTRIMSMTFRKTPEETDLAEDGNAVVGFIIFIVMKPLLLAGMPGFPPEKTEETEPVRCLLSPASVLC